ncbi:MAG: retinol dehydrogenase 12 [Acidimicrobiaceae bacterium]|jgi:NAD(P)-dependent dehydrogenase (short-subunit alcohol dehydrogenase family)
MKGKTVVITGANTGIGRETAVGLAEMGATVVLACRNRSKAAAAAHEVRTRSNHDDVHLVDLDLADLDSVRTCAAEVLDQWDRLDVLINNAGLQLKERTTTKQGFETTFGVNHLGHFYLTYLLLDRLRAAAPARIVNVSSVGHHFARAGLPWDDLQHDVSRYTPSGAYCESKLANLLFTRELAQRLPPSEVTVNACHPGAVRSEFGSSEDMGKLYGTFMKAGAPFLISPKSGARTSIYLASSPEVEGKTGGYYVRRKLRSGSKQSRDEQAAARLWAVTEELLASVGAR